MGLRMTGNLSVRSRPQVLIGAVFTESSEVKYSAADTFELYAAHNISLDFFSVSSILHAVNKAAAAASDH